MMMGDELKADDAELKPALDEKTGAQSSEGITQSWESAQEIKAEGNAHFKAGCPAEALQCYQRALGFLDQFKDSFSGFQVPATELRELRISLYSNSAACQLQQEDWLGCIESAEKVLTIQGKNLKALYRRGVANARLGHLTKAKEDLLYVAKNDLKNKKAREELTAVKDKIKQAKQEDKVRMGGMFEGKSVYSEAMAAQAEKSATTKREEAALDARLQEEWAVECAAREEEKESKRPAVVFPNKRRTDIEEEWVQELARRKAEDPLEAAMKAAMGGSQKAQQFEDFKLERTKQKAEQLEKDRIEFFRCRIKEMENEESAEDAAQKDVDKEAEKRREEERDVRMRARIAVDQKTALELDNEDEALLADIKKDGYCYFAADSAKAKAGLEAQGYKQAPKKIDAAEAEDEASSGASTWNREGTTFEERDHSSWAQNELRTLLLKANATVGSSKAEVTKLDISEGSATTVISQGIKKPYFEFELKVEWEMTLQGHVRKVKGYTTYTELSSRTLKDRTFQHPGHFTQSPTAEDAALADELEKALAGSLLHGLDEFAQVFEAK